MKTLLGRVALRVFAVVAILATPLAIGQTPAQADTGCRDSFQRPYPSDKGGKNATVWITREAECGELKNAQLWAVFHAYDELLVIYNYPVAGKVYVNVEVLDRYGNVLDKDRITGTEKTHELGTPDGSRDIVEGRVVRIQVCGTMLHSNKKECSAWGTGVA
ncbi:hypothetical protein [Amycolatopsis sp. NPDC057786]|uniref:hypothetical protein n=1 Tax=Amycolatopsis sp. NPDC057786 TaxID=3346250 RepID=UPI00366AD756